ncbi:MAG: DoxX family membrane protein [Candidatus Rokubacteria bacterium]|nr:DoxX family membrane protein [Candidatus Rokubacteria bacterium]
MILHLATRALLGTVFLAAGIPKSLDHQAFVVAVDAYALLPRAVVPPFAAALPWLEIAIGLFLLVGLFVRVAGAASAGLAAMFIVALAQAKVRGLAIDCGCFGGGGAGSGVTWWEILRDVPLLLAGGFLAWRPRGPLQLDRQLMREADDHEEGERVQHEPEDRASRAERSAPPRGSC